MRTKEDGCRGRWRLWDGEWRPLMWVQGYSGRERKFCKPDYVFGDGALIISRHNGILNKVGTVQLQLALIYFHSVKWRFNKYFLKDTKHWRVKDEEYFHVIFHSNTRIIPREFRHHSSNATSQDIFFDTIMNILKRVNFDSIKYFAETSNLPIIHEGDKLPPPSTFICKELPKFAPKKKVSFRSGKRAHDKEKRKSIR